MASKFMVNAAFEARLLLRPSHQRTVLFGTINKPSSGKQQGSSLLLFFPCLSSSRTARCNSKAQDELVLSERMDAFLFISLRYRQPEQLFAL